MEQGGVQPTGKLRCDLETSRRRNILQGECHQSGPQSGNPFLQVHHCPGYPRKSQAPIFCAKTQYGLYVFTVQSSAYGKSSVVDIFDSLSQDTPIRPRRRAVQGRLKVHFRWGMGGIAAKRAPLVACGS